MNMRKSGKQEIYTAGKKACGRGRLFAGAVCMLCLLCCVLTAAAEESAVAAVMQLMKTEGEVTVSNGAGRNISLIENMRLYNGYSAATQEESYAWINLDSEKLAKLDAVSEAEVRKSGKKLEILLDSGNLFFNVTEELKEDETLNIRTSTMVMGIRGTCGWVRVLDRWHSQVYILEGEVECSVTDPVTGQVKTTVLKSGEMAEFVVYSSERTGDKCDIIRQGFSGDEIPGFVLVELAGNDLLCQKIRDASGIDVKSYAANAEARLAAEQEEMRQKMNNIRRLFAKQASYISRDPVWERGKASPHSSPNKKIDGTGNREGNHTGIVSGTGGTPGSGAGSGGSGTALAPAASGERPGAASAADTGGGNTDEAAAPPVSDTSNASDASDTPVEPTPDTPAESAPAAPAPDTSAPGTPAAPQEPVNAVTMPTDATLDDIIAKLNEDGVDQVIVPDDLVINRNLTIPAGKTLTVQGDLEVAVLGPDAPGSTVTVKGDLEIGGNLTNNGTIDIGDVERLP